MVHVVKGHQYSTSHINGGTSITEMESEIDSTSTGTSFDASITGDELDSTRSTTSELQIGRGTMHAIYSARLALCTDFKSQKGSMEALNFLIITS